MGFGAICRLIHPAKMIVGMISMSLAVLTFAYFSMEGRAVHQFKKNYPASGIALTLIVGCFLTYTLGSLLVFLVGILLPFSGKTIEIHLIRTAHRCSFIIINMKKSPVTLIKLYLHTTA